MKQRARLIILVACALGAAASWGVLLTRLATPGMVPGGYNSDSAVPVLMANEERFGIESLYYWSQDRFGGVPFAFGSLLHRTLGIVWTPASWSVMQALWVALSIAVMAWWTRSAAVTLTWACVLVAGAWPLLLYDICQPYAWQLTWLVAALAVLHRRAEEDWRGVTGAALLALLTLLAHWANSMSGLWLLGIALAELIIRSGRRVRLALGAVLPIVVGIALEGALRAVFQVHYKHAHGFSVATQVWLEVSELPKYVALAFAPFEAWQLVTLLACPAIALAWLLRRKVPAWAAYPAVCAIANMLIPPLVAHLRTNGMASKYFTLAAFFAPFACAALAVEWLSKRWPVAAALPAVGLLALGPLLLGPAWGRDGGFAKQLELARTLAAQRPGAFLSSGYWDTYLLASLSPPGALKPVARFTQFQRTPQLYDALGKSDAVWVGDQGSDGAEPRLIAFYPHVPIGRDLFVPAGPVFSFEGKELRLYRAATQAVHLAPGKACPDAPLELQVPATAAGAEVIAVVPRLDPPLELEGAPEPSREGPLTVWRVGAAAQTWKLRAVGPECVGVQLFALPLPPT